MADDYDITEAFRKIEDELITSMLQNMKRHKDWETKEGFQWSMWQVEQLKSLERYKQQNLKKYGKQFDRINGRIDRIIDNARKAGGMEQEVEILEAINKGFKPGKKPSAGASAQFFRLNTKKLEALIKATKDDLEKAEHAMLRKANDEYRKVIFNAQVYANAGAGTYEKAVDMATKDFLSKGIDCVEYSNSAKHSISDYADMAIRTASKRAKLAGEGEKRAEWGISTVIMNKRGNPCPKCLPFCGKILIDDVWSGGSKEGVDPETKKKYPTMSYAIECGLYHPRCKDSHTTYFPGITSAEDGWNKKELEEIGLKSKQEAKQQYAKRQVENFERLAKYSLDGDNKKHYTGKAEEWMKIANKYSDGSIEKTKDYDIIEMYRKGSTHRKLAPSGKQIIDEATYHKITNPAVKDGADIRIAEGEFLEHIRENGTALTLGDVIFFTPERTVSDVLEEVHHFYQNKRGLNNKYGHKQREILNEIDAKEYLLSMTNKYRIPLEEVEETKQHLEFYKKQMQDMKERGEWID